MPQTIGIVLIFLSCILFVHQKAEGLIKTLQNVKQMKQALIYMKNEISFSSKALAEVTASLQYVLTGNIGQFFSQLSSYLSANETADFGQAWEHAKGCFGNKPFLPAAADSILTDFSRQAGKLPREAELENFEKTINDLDVEIANANETYPQKCKLIYTLGVCAATAVLILFL